MVFPCTDPEWHNALHGHYDAKELIRVHAVQSAKMVLLTNLKMLSGAKKDWKDDAFAQYQQEVNLSW